MKLEQWQIGAILVVAIVLIIGLFYFKKNIEMFETKDYLEGIDVIYWINLDRSKDRRKRMEKMFKNPVFKGKKIIRISAVDGKAANIDQFLNANFVGMQPEKFTKVEYACLLSHLNTIKQFSESNDQVALIMEDDMTLEYKKYWKKSTKEIMNEAPNNWEILQLCYIINSGMPFKKYTKYKNGNFASAGAYILNKNKIINNLKLLTYNISHEADHYLFNRFNTYAYKYPMFIYGTNENSTIHQDHINGHNISKEKIKKLFTNQK
jgi:GR25 family glycosyltransferase involved in LPS biosynthesis